jgi:hypothetical protein
MKANLLLDIEIPDYALVLARARAWEKEHKYKYDLQKDLITDYLMSDVNIGYFVDSSMLFDEKNNIIED